jgi:NADH dehydrogenase
MVTNVDATGVDLRASDGSTHRIAARTVLWAAGVRSSPLGRRVGEQAGAEMDRGGRVKVGPDLSVPGHPEIFIAGDLAHYVQDGQPLPGLAPVAIQQGRYVARVIARRLRGETAPGPFRYFDKGTLATIGRDRAVGVIGKLHTQGFVAWIIWLFVHLMYLVGFQNRLLVLIQWAFYYFTFNRRARLITGEDVLPLRKPVTRRAGE